MQSLDVISVNLWQIVVSLLNLLLLFLIVKKFLFKPVEKMIAKRQENIENQFKEAEEAKNMAISDMEKWSEKLKNADKEADLVMQNAIDSAKINGEKIISDAKEKADGIVKQAETKAELEKKNAKEFIKSQIVDISALLAAKMINRELKKEDHKNLIDEFIDKIGESDD